MTLKFLFLILLLDAIKCIDIDVKTTSGIVRGQTILNHTVNQFLSIPYAEPPIGNLRFAKPKPITTPNETIDATKPKIACMQPHSQFTTSEDCLILNIWCPQPSNALKPVMFWIHGGGLNGGSIFLNIHNGSVLATHDVVVVSANYRLGKFGFLYGGEESAPGNVGLYDQVMALKWVRENIHLFGGDKNKITVFGQSAGGRSISALIISPETKGLFKRVIMESGSVMHYKNRGIQTKSEAISESKEFAKRLNCTDDKQWLQCLRNVDSKEINKIENISTFPLEGTDFLPNSVQDAFSKTEYLQEIDILAGVAKNEGSLLAYDSFSRLRQKVPELNINDFDVLVKQTNEIYHGLNTEIVKNHFNITNSSNSNALREAFYELFGDIHVKCPTYLFAKQFAKQTPKAKTYFYELDFEAKFIQKMGCDPKTMGICHGADIELVFGLPLLNPDKYSSVEVEFSKTIMKLWTNFAKTGVPDSTQTQFTPMVTNNTIKINLLHPQFMGKTLSDPYPNSCDGFWKNYYN